MSCQLLLEKSYSVAMPVSVVGRVNVFVWNVIAFLNCEVMCSSWFVVSIEGTVCFELRSQHSLLHVPTVAYAAITN